MGTSIGPTLVFAACAIPGERRFHRLRVADDREVRFDRVARHTRFGVSCTIRFGIVGEHARAGLGIEKRRVVAEAALLVAIGHRERVANAIGCGRDNMVSEARRWG